MDSNQRLSGSSSNIPTVIRPIHDRRGNEHVENGRRTSDCSPRNAVTIDCKWLQHESRLEHVYGIPKHMRLMTLGVYVAPHV